MSLCPFVVRNVSSENCVKSQYTDGGEREAW